jgi:hypothetical protein
VDRQLAVATSPSAVGDVLFLRTRRSYTVYVVGVVMFDGQDDFRRRQPLYHFSSEVEALRTAHALAARDCQIYVRDIDTSQVSEIRPLPRDPRNALAELSE